MIIKKIVSGVLGNNSYIVYNQGYKDAILIDPAKGYKKTCQYLQENNLNIVACLITHGHFDHILEASLWQKRGAKLYIHHLDADKLHSEKSLNEYFKVNLTASTADYLVKDGEVLQIAGLNINVIHTPGHSEGSVCYLIGDNLFSGDTLFSGDFGRSDFPDGSFDKLKSSIKKLFNLSGDYTVFTGHDEQTTLEKERKTNEILRYL